MKAVLRRLILSTTFITSIVSADAQFTDIVNFDGAVNPKGSIPYGDVIRSGKVLYGMTSSGGANGFGDIFSVDTNGANYKDLLDFNGTSAPKGANPEGSLLLVGNKLYGMTEAGGTNNDGDIFSMDTNGTSFTDIYDFAGGSSGSHPYGGLTIIGYKLYGMTEAGGVNSTGNIFSIDSNGGSYKNLWSFQFLVSTNGSYPYGNLTHIGNVFYGMTSFGGANDSGCIFRIDTNGNGYKDLVSFNGPAVPKGAYPRGSLTLSGNKFYGLQQNGGPSNDGLIFSVDTNGNAYKDMLDFTGANGMDPYGSLSYYNGNLYGMTSGGGTHNDGNIFSIDTNGTGFVQVFDFAGANGKKPLGDLLISSGNVYGMTNVGGTHNLGTVFAFDPFIIVKVIDTNISCFGGSNGRATAVATGGIHPYTYLWSPAGGTDSTATGLSAGTYTVYVHDIYDNVDSAVITLTQPAVLSATANTTANVLCNGGSNGSASSTVSGGVTPYTYLWAPSGGNAPTAAGLTAGTYTLTVHDNNGCVSTSSTTITQPAAALADGTPTLNSNVPCFGGDGSATAATPTGGTTPYTYSWNGGATSTNATNSTLSAGTYTVNVTDAHGCLVNSSGTVTITQPAAALADGTPTLNSNVPCFGGDGSATAATPTGGTTPYTYSWNGGATSTNATNSTLSAGTYTVNVTDAHGCMVNSSGTVTITQPAAALADGTPTLNSNVLCFGGDGSATAAIPTGGTSPYTYSWNGGATSTNATNSTLSAGTYTVNVTDAHGCMVNSSGTVTITQPAAALADGTPTLNSNILCFGGNGSATAATPTGGTSPYTYSWNGGATSTNATNSTLSAGTYTVNVTDANGCMVNSSGTVTITQPAVLADGTPILNSNVPCFGGDGSATAATPTGGTTPYTYSWNGGATSTNATNSTLSAGTYTVNVTDANGCMVNSSGTITITQPAAALADGIPTLNSNVLCFGGDGSATAATPTGGTSPYTYAWNGGATSTNATNSTLSAGTYTVNVTDANGCLVNSSGTVTITQPAAALADGTPILNSNVQCFGGFGSATAATPTGGTSPYTYSWNGGATSTNATNSTLSAGTYTVNVTDANGCIVNSSGTVTITQPAAALGITIASVVNSGGCVPNGSITANAATGGTGPYAYNWTPAGGTNLTTSPLGGGSYTITVTDNNGCTSSATATITQPTIVSISIASQVDVPCNGGVGSITANPASGGNPPYTYSWSPSGGTNLTATGLSAGTYFITATDNNGCSNNAFATLTQPPALSVAAGVTADETCNGGNTGSLSSTVSGGTSPYTYSWTPAGGSNPTATGLTAGTYTLSITDNNGCTGTASVTITQPNVLSASASVTANETCHGGSIGSTSSLVSGGTTPYTYSWSGGGGTNTTATGLSAGTYTLTVNDACGATSTSSATITQPAILNAVAVETAGVSCHGGNNGTASSVISGGTSPFTYAWSGGGGTNNTATGLSAGTYTVTVHDACGGSSTSSITITQPATISLVEDSLSTSTGTTCNGSAWIHVSGGTAPFTYKWQGGQTTDSISGQCPGSYCCKVTDANGCKDSICVTVTVTGIDNVTANSAEIKVYPNPNNGKFAVSITNYELPITNLEVYNMLGEKVYSQFNIQQPAFSIDMSNQPNGVYMYRIISDTGDLLGQGKLIIQK